MSRLRADFLLLLAGLIWGFGFVAQKDAVDHVGPFTFIACRFLISALFVAPFAFRERARLALNTADIVRIGLLCTVFAAAVVLQQIGLGHTTVTNTAFITGIYVVLVPFACRALYGHKIAVYAVPLAALSFVGTGLLSGANAGHLISAFNSGDAIVFACAFFFALQIAMMGHVGGAVKAPLILSCVQYLGTGLLALMIACAFERMTWSAITDAWIPILYAGVASGGIAYTLQAVAQQHAPAADTAIILSSESLFGAVGGAWLLHEKLTFSGYVGCALIMVSILLVEALPLVRRRTRPA